MYLDVIIDLLAPGGGLEPPVPTEASLVCKALDSAVSQRRPAPRRIRERRAGPPATYYLTTAEGEGFAVPMWMTAEAAAEVRYEAQPRLDLRALVQIAGLTEKGLESAEPREEVLPSDQAKESLHGDSTDSN
jgi:hypothetical protein